MLELAEKVMKLTGSGGQIQFHPLPEDDPKRRRPNISLASQEVNWEPKISLDEGLKATIEYFRQVLSL